MNNAPAVKKDAAPAPTGAHVTLSKWMETDKVKSKFESFLGQKRAPQFLASLLSVVSNDAKLQECDPASILQSAMMAATLGLYVEKNLGQAFILPYWDSKTKRNVAQFQMGYKGFIQLAINTGQYKSLNAVAISESQIKSYNPITEEYDFDFTIPPNGQKIYFAYFKMLNGFEKYVSMTETEIKAHAMKFSQSFKKGFGPWADDFDAMACKTVLKRLISRWGLMSTQLQTAIQADQAEVEYDKSTDGFTAKYVDNGGDLADLPKAEVVSESGADYSELFALAAKADAATVAIAPETVKVLYDSFGIDKNQTSVLDTDSAEQFVEAVYQELSRLTGQPDKDTAPLINAFVEARYKWQGNEGVK